MPDQIGLLSAPNVLSSEIVELVKQATGQSVRFRDVSRILAEALSEDLAGLEMFRIASQIATEAMQAMFGSTQTRHARARGCSPR